MGSVSFRIFKRERFPHHEKKFFFKLIIVLNFHLNEKISFHLVTGGVFSFHFCTLCISVVDYFRLLV